MKNAGRITALVLLGFYFSFSGENRWVPKAFGSDDKRTNTDGSDSIPERFILLVNMENAVDANRLEQGMLAMRDRFRVPVHTATIPLERHEDPAAAAERFFRERPRGAVAVILLWPGRAEDRDLPLLVAPERMWALFNVDWSHDDSLPENRHAERVFRQIGRAVGYLFDVPYTIDPRALMRRIRTPEELDGLSYNFFPPNQVVFERNARHMGLPDSFVPAPREQTPRDP